MKPTYRFQCPVFVVRNARGLEGTDDWKQEEERMIQELSRGAKGETGTNLVSIQLASNGCLEYRHGEEPIVSCFVAGMFRISSLFARLSEEEHVEPGVYFPLLSL